VRVFARVLACFAGQKALSGVSFQVSGVRKTGTAGLRDWGTTGLREGDAEGDAGAGEIVADRRLGPARCLNCGAEAWLPKRGIARQCGRCE
jgi:hypothetical protein